MPFLVHFVLSTLTMNGSVARKGVCTVLIFCMLLPIRGYCGVSEDLKKFVDKAVPEGKAVARAQARFTELKLFVDWISQAQAKFAEASSRRQAMMASWEHLNELPRSVCDPSDLDLTHLEGSYKALFLLQQYRTNLVGLNQPLSDIEDIAKEFENACDKGFESYTIEGIPHDQAPNVSANMKLYFELTPIVEPLVSTYVFEQKSVMAGVAKSLGMTTATLAVIIIFLILLIDGISTEIENAEIRGQIERFERERIKTPEYQQYAREECEQIRGEFKPVMDVLVSHSQELQLELGAQRVLDLDQRIAEINQCVSGYSTSVVGAIEAQITHWFTQKFNWFSARLEGKEDSYQAILAMNRDLKALETKECNLGFDLVDAIRTSLLRSEELEHGKLSRAVAEKARTALAARFARCPLEAL